MDMLLDIDQYGPVLCQFFCTVHMTHHVDGVLAPFRAIENNKATTPTIAMSSIIYKIGGYG